MGNRLGVGAKRLATLIFQIGGILGQSVRVLVAALALKVVTPLDFHQCIWIIGFFAVCWTLMGGMHRYMDGCYAILSLRGSRSFQLVLDRLSA